jgi:hypothetical protein
MAGKPRPGRCADALNRGIGAANGRFCLFLGDDISVKPERLAEYLQAQQYLGDTVGVGQLILAVPENAGWYARAFAEGWRRHYEALNAGDAAFTWEDCYSGNMSAPRGVLLRCGGFDSGLPRGFDLELAHRIEQAGCTLRYLPAAMGYQDERRVFRELSSDIEAAGATDFELCASERGLCWSALQSFGSGHQIKARMTLRIPPRLLAAVGGLVPSRRYQYLFHSLLQNLCYWRGGA